MDRQLRAEVVSEMRKVMQDVLEGTNEVWVSGEQLAKQFSCFSKSWLKTYGQSLPRTRTIVTDANGIEHEGAWTYPLHRIQRLMMNNGVKNLKIK